MPGRAAPRADLLLRRDARIARGLERAYADHQRSTPAGQADAVLFLRTIGLITGLSAALVLTAVRSNRLLSARELHLLWPMPAFGIDFADWWDGNVWHFLRLLLVFVGNGVIYALAGSCFGALADLLRK